MEKYRKDTDYEELRKERAKSYGPHTLIHANLGLMWTGILQTYFRANLNGVIPPHIVELMLSALKMNRCASPSEVQKMSSDSYLDCANYIQLAELSSKGAIKTNESETTI